MKVLELDPSSIVINAAIAARAGEPDKDKIQHFAENMVQRRCDGMSHQIMPGVVRAVKDDGYELIVGRHRLEAERMLNDSLGDGEEPFLFHAVVVRADDTAALINAIQENEYRVASNIFDRAASVEKLLALGQTQAQVAKAFGLSEPEITRTLKAGKLPKKLRKMVEDGDMEQDAAVLIAEIDSSTKDKVLVQEIIESAISNRNKMDEFSQRHQKSLEAKQAEAEAEKAEKEGDKEAAKKSKNKAAAAKKEATAPPKKSKVSKEDVKEAAKSKGAIEGPSPISKNRFYNIIEAIGSDKDNPVPKSARDLIGKLEARMDGEISDVQLRNAFMKFCRPD